MKFNIGDRVRWTSQAGGHAKEKRGEVVAIVPAGTDARDVVPRDLSDGPMDAYGLPRGEESYIVRVKRSAYWPRACHLKKDEA